MVATHHTPDSIATFGALFVTPALESCGRLRIDAELERLAWVTRVSWLATFDTGFDGTLWARYVGVLWCSDDGVNSLLSLILLLLLLGLDSRQQPVGYKSRTCRDRAIHRIWGAPFFILLPMWE
jgi:hypothetical protein